MALARDEAVAGTPAPRALIVANLLVFLVAILTLAITLPPRIRQHQEGTRRETWRQSLADAARRGALPAIRVLVAGKAPLGEDATDALNTAAQAGNSEVVKVLLEHGALPNPKQGHYTETPLSCAIESDHLNTALVLLRGGADVNFAGSSGVTPLHSAAANGNLPAIRLLLKRGARLEAQSRSGETPLQIATRAGQDEAVRYLKSLGAKDAPAK
jgi:ankyrin repeat protein